MCRARPPVGLGLHIPQYHVLNGYGQAGHLPRYVRLPAAPRLRQMLQNGLGLVLLNTLGHHVEYVVHDGSAQLQIVMRLDALLGDRFGDAFRVTSLELTREQIAKPTLEQWRDATQEEQPDAPAGRPKSTAGSFAHRTRVKSIINKMLQVFAHANLLH